MLWIVLALMVLTLPLRWIIAAVLAAAVHELGHLLALKALGIPVRGIHFGLTGAKIRVGTLTKYQELLCALAGPLAGLSLCLLSSWFPRTAVCAFISSIYNLLPIYPLDGGRVIRCLGAGERLVRCLEPTCLSLILAAGVYASVFLRLGFGPLLVAGLTIHHVLLGKGLEKRRGFRYNRKRIYE